jgi:hypothetical protein
VHRQWLNVPGVARYLPRWLPAWLSAISLASLMFERPAIVSNPRPAFGAQAPDSYHRS